MTAPAPLFDDPHFVVSPDFDQRRNSRYSEADISASATDTSRESPAKQRRISSVIVLFVFEIEPQGADGLPSSGRQRGEEAQTQHRQPHCQYLLRCVLSVTCSGAFGASFKKKTLSKKELLAQQHQSQGLLENAIDITARTSVYYLGPVSGFQVCCSFRCLL